mgnify:CR=1 FL=1
MNINNLSFLELKELKEEIKEKISIAAERLDKFNERFELNLKLLHKKSLIEKDEAFFDEEHTDHFFIIKQNNDIELMRKYFSPISEEEPNNEFIPVYFFISPSRYEKQTPFRYNIFKNAFNSFHYYTDLLKAVQKKIDEFLLDNDILDISRNIEEKFNNIINSKELERIKIKELFNILKNYLYHDILNSLKVIQSTNIKIDNSTTKNVLFYLIAEIYNYYDYTTGKKKTQEAVKKCYYEKKKEK